jgi:predicted acyl esterase
MDKQNNTNNEPYTGKIRTRQVMSIDLPDARYKGFHPGKITTLKTGYQHLKGALPLNCDLVLEKDVALIMRDGMKLYADIFRPVGDKAVPVIINWSPYGKGQTGYWDLDNKVMFPNRFGIKKSQVSGLQSWEGVDPAYWCAHGYAVVQIDARGAFDSEGDAAFSGPGEGCDGYDAIEELAKLEWCSGKIAFAGNSWLAMAQWGIAAQCPPHLAAIAPWEGLTDSYKQVLNRGGVTQPAFIDSIRDNIFGRNGVEDIIAMLEDHPLFDDYWASKIPDVARIDVPAYVVASYSNPLHVPGTLSAFSALTSPKWLRVHNTFEWPDFYSEKATEDLHCFFDRYLLDLDNKWEDTPQVRMSVLDLGHEDTIERIEDAFPPKRVKPLKLFLNASTGSMNDTPVTSEGVIGYDVQSRRSYVDFTYQFDRDIEIIGTPVINLWLSVDGHDDANIFVHLEKLDKKGKQLWHQKTDLGLPFGRTLMPLAQRCGVKVVGAAFYGGPDGVLRASRRGMDENAPKNFPQLDLTQEHKLKPNQPTELDIPLWPTAMRWHAGEQLRIRVSAESLLAPVLPGLPTEEKQPGKRHNFHTGGEFASSIIIPVTPA